MSPESRWPGQTRVRWTRVCPVITEITYNIDRIMRSMLYVISVICYLMLICVWISYHCEPVVGLRVRFCTLLETGHVSPDVNWGGGCHGYEQLSPHLTETIGWSSDVIMCTGTHTIPSRSGLVMLCDCELVVLVSLCFRRILVGGKIKRDNCFVTKHSSSRSRVFVEKHWTSWTIKLNHVVNSL